MMLFFRETLGSLGGLNSIEVGLRMLLSDVKS